MMESTKILKTVFLLLALGYQIRGISGVGTGFCLLTCTHDGSSTPIAYPENDYVACYPDGIARACCCVDKTWCVINETDVNATRTECQCPVGRSGVCCECSDTDCPPPGCDDVSGFIIPCSSFSNDVFIKHTGISVNITGIADEQQLDQATCQNSCLQQNCEGYLYSSEGPACKIIQASSSSLSARGLTIIEDPLFDSYLRQCETCSL